MAQTYHRRPRSDPLTEEEIKQRYVDIQDELQEVMKWKAEEEAKLADEKSSPQKKGAAKRALKKIDRRIDTVNGQIIYWKLRVAGQSHFRAGIEMNEYWAECREKKEAAAKLKAEAELPDLLKRK